MGVLSCRALSVCVFYFIYSFFVPVLRFLSVGCLCVFSVCLIFFVNLFIEIWSFFYDAILVVTSCMALKRVYKEIVDTEMFVRLKLNWREGELDSGYGDRCGEGPAGRRWLTRCGQAGRQGVASEGGGRRRKEWTRVGEWVEPVCARCMMPVIRWRARARKQPHPHPTPPSLSLSLCPLEAPVAAHIWRRQHAQPHCESRVTGYRSWGGLDEVFSIFIMRYFWLIRLSV